MFLTGLIVGLGLGFIVARLAYKPTQEFDEHVKKLEAEVRRLRPKKRGEVINIASEDIF